jgi:hypothetical protein
MSGGLRKSSDFHHIKVREIVVQNTDGTFPPIGSVIHVVSDRGKTDWTQDISLNSVTLNPGGVVTYNGMELVVNGLPLVNARYIQDLSGLFDNSGAFVDTSSGSDDTDSFNFSVPVSGYYMISNKYSFSSPVVPPYATNYLSTAIYDTTTGPYVNIANDIKTNVQYFAADFQGSTNTTFSSDMTVYLVSGTIYNMSVSASGIGPFTVTQSVCIRIY